MLSDRSQAAPGRNAARVSSEMATQFSSVKRPPSVFGKENIHKRSCRILAREITEDDVIKKSTGSSHSCVCGGGPIHVAKVVHVRVGAVDALPDSSCKFMRRKCSCISGPERYFVKEYPGLDFPGTFVRVRSFSRTFCWIHNSETSKFRILPIPSRRAIPSAAVASDKISMSCLMPRSSPTLRRPIPMSAPLHRPVISASPEDKAKVACVLDQCFKQCWPNIAAPPLVLRRETRHPAKSVSTNSWRCFGVYCHLYL